MPDAPISILPEASGGGSPTSPVLILGEASGGGSPTSPVSILGEVSGGGSPTSPVSILGEASGGGSPTSPVSILGEASGGGSPTSPVSILSEAAASDETPSFTFSESENPDLDGRYVYLGLLEGTSPVWARDDSTLTLPGGILTGAGYYFVQIDTGASPPAYPICWYFNYATELPAMSPSTLMVTPTRLNREVEPTPWQATGWFSGELSLGDQIFVSNVKPAPVSILTEFSSASSPSAPVSVLP